MQKTINVEGKKIKLVTRPITSMGNITGYRTHIDCRKNGLNIRETFVCMTLDPQTAMDRAFVLWIKGLDLAKELRA
jgi:hypothetical protein